MTIEIKASTKVADFQKAFEKRFPYLKVVFFHQPLEDIEGTWSGYVVLDVNITFATLSDMLPTFDEPFTFSPNITVAEFENTLANCYGLTVRIFRKYQGDWVETNATRHLNLEGQNELGVLNAPNVEDIIL